MSRFVRIMSCLAMLALVTTVVRLPQASGQGGPPAKNKDAAKGRFFKQKQAALGELNQLLERALELYNDGRYQEAETFARRAIAFATQNFGAEHRSVARGHIELARIYQRVGRGKEAEQHARHALAIRERELGPDSARVAGALVSLGSALMAQGKYKEAEIELRRAVAIMARANDFQRAFLPGHIKLLLGFSLLRQGRYAEAEAVLRDALATQEQAMGPDDIWTTRIVRPLASLAAIRGNFGVAEELFKRAIGAMERATGRDRSELADALSGYAGLLVQQGRYGEAEPIFRRALSAYEGVHGPNSSLVADVLTGLGELYVESGRAAEGEPLLHRALKVRETAQGADHPDMVATLRWHGNALAQLGRQEHAEAVLKRAVLMGEQAFGAGDVRTARAVLALGRTLLAGGRAAEGEAAIERAIAALEKSAGPEHPVVAGALQVLGEHRLKSGRAGEALDVLRRASTIAVMRSRAGDRLGMQARSTEFRPQLRRNIHGWLSAAAWALAEKRPDFSPQLLEEALVAAQLNGSTTTAAAVNQMAARFSIGDSALAELLRRGQDLANRGLELERELTLALAGEHGDEFKAGPRDRAALRHEIDRNNAALAEAVARLAREFPDYARLAGEDPLTVKEVQALLRPGEALIAFLVLHNGTLVFALTRDEVRWHKAPLGRPDLARQIEALRCGLDDAAWDTRSAAARCKSHGLALASPDLLPFDLALAHGLYQKLLAPLEGMLAGKELLVVPSGPLTSLPLHVLITEPAPERLPDMAGYGRAAWLARRHAVTTLPSIPSLKALRIAALGKPADQPLIGFGAPAFTGGGQAVAIRPSPTVGGGGRGKDAYATYFKGSRVDPALLRQLAELPETAVELRAVARALGAAESDLMLGSLATEARVKAAALANYRIVYFATHGLVAGEVDGLGEPALALTLPASPADVDDGLLTASEVARLRLNADWVILSACNTAAGHRPGAEALSGLARAFFYAGARGLLVSHWRVDSEAAVLLTTLTFAELSRGPGLTRAEALRRTMIALAERGGGATAAAHPSYWAPFVIIGGGA